MAIWTIGHSNLPVGRVISLLKAHEIAVVVDVRSAPYSAWAEQFNKREIESTLIEAGFDYIYAGDRLGGKPDDEKLHTVKGVPDYDLIAQSPRFREALGWLVGLAEQKRVAIMCSEADPFACHREKLLGKELRERGVEVLHITSDGEVVVQEQGALF